MKKLGLKIFVGVVTVAVIAAVGVGIYLVGSPSNERARRTDEQRIQNLHSIAAAVNQYYTVRGGLPATLEIMLADVEAVGGFQTELRDPKTAQPYEYKITSATNFTLCAVFETENTQTDSFGKSLPYPAYPTYPGYYDYWSVVQNHDIGRTCFDLRVIGMVGISCDAAAKCPPNYTCAVIAGRPAECILAGTECAVAGCPGGQTGEADTMNCIIAESYPSQIRCESKTASQCELMKEKATGKVDCFGCGQFTCKDPAAGWEPYTAPSEPGYVGIPYGCYDDPVKGCSLAQ